MIQAYLQQCVPSNTLHFITFALGASVLKSFQSKSWACRIWVLNVNNLINIRYCMSSVKQTLSSKAVFTKAKIEFSYRVTFCIFMWPKLIYIRVTHMRQMEKLFCLIQEIAPPSLPSTHTGKRKDQHKHKAYRVCLLTCVYTKCSNIPAGT